MQQVLQEEFDELEKGEAIQCAAALEYFVEEQMKNLEWLLQCVGNGRAKDDAHHWSVWRLLTELPLPYLEFAKRFAMLKLDEARSFSDVARKHLDDFQKVYDQYEKCEGLLQRVAERGRQKQRGAVLDRSSDKARQDFGLR